MPFDNEKMRLEARLLGLLSQALQDRNRDDIVSSLLALGELYLSADLYEKSEEYFRRILDEPVSQLARHDERARARLSLAAIALRRGRLGDAAEGQKRAGELVPPSHAVQLDVRRLQCEIDLHVGRYREVVDVVESTLTNTSPDKLGDHRVDLMLLEGRARRLMGRNRQALRLLEKALDLAQKAGYEPGTAAAHSELGRLLTVIGKFKPAQEHLTAALHSSEAAGSPQRLNVDGRRMALLHLKMGRWSEAEELLRKSYQSSRDLGTLESRLGSQLVLANLQRLRGNYDDAADMALDGMEASRAAGYVRRQVQGLLCLGQIAFDRGQVREALEPLREAEVLYGRIGPESNTMILVHACLGRVHDALGETAESFDRLMRAHNLARETGNDYERNQVDSFLGDHYRKRGEEEKAAELLTRAARELGALGAKYDVARARLWLAELLGTAKMAHSLEERQREVKLARSNVFEARRLLDLMGAAKLTAECDRLDAKLQPERPAASTE